jgi:uncharacterized protein (TIGR00369 family)
MARDTDRTWSPSEVERVGQVLRDVVPQNRAIGLELVRMRSLEVWTRLPWNPRLVGDPVRGRLHGGALATLVDATCGLAIMARLEQPAGLATIDLRVDHLRASPTGQPVYAWASCFRVTRSVCFVRGGASSVLPPPGEAPPEDALIVAATGTFARKRA